MSDKNQARSFADGLAHHTMTSTSRASSRSTYEGRLRNNNNNNNNNNDNSNTITTTTPTSIRLEELRVAKQELRSGDQSGCVYLRLSSGSVAFPTDRTIAQTRIDRLIQQTIEEMEK